MMDQRAMTSIPLLWTAHPLFLVVALVRPDATRLQSSLTGRRDFCVVVVPDV